MRDKIRFRPRIITEVPGSVTQIVFSDLDTDGAFNAYAQAERSSETQVRFTVRFRDVTPDTYQIVWDNAIWNIVNAVHDNFRSMLIIDCEAPRIEVTHLQSTEREFIDPVPVVNPRSE